MRTATADDIPALVAMGKRFHAQSRQPMRYDEAAIAALLGKMAGSVFMHEHGCIGGVLAPAYCDPQWIMAVELFWWADRDGLQLLRAFEEWAVESGANEIRMTSLASLPRADVLLRRKGYAATEISYSRVI